MIFRDIKPSNILLGRDGEAKLCDFGFAVHLDINSYLNKSQKGTPNYMAPEILEGKPYDEKADLW